MASCTVKSVQECLDFLLLVLAGFRALVRVFLLRVQLAVDHLQLPANLRGIFTPVELLLPDLGVSLVHACWVVARVLHQLCSLNTSVYVVAGAMARGLARKLTVRRHNRPALVEVLSLVILHAVMTT